MYPIAELLVHWKREYDLEAIIAQKHAADRLETLH